MRTLTALLILAGAAIVVLRFLNAYRITAKFEMRRRDQDADDGMEMTALFEMNRRG
ncbi:MAG: hypothetical protein OYI31_03450 [Chloroflexota bacterium]|nr:hypothetical protein [Chloroflexota bacterium]MDE2942197.1 hypothetical protein [Chloroflexota bacterium]MDE3267502.1 hypothetical protein [Chloroflexota bacterium]